MCKNAGGDVHRIHEAQTFFYAALLDRGGDIGRDIDYRVPILRIHPEIFGVGFHSVLFCSRVGILTPKGGLALFCKNRPFNIYTSYAILFHCRRAKGFFLRLDGTFFYAIGHMLKYRDLR